VKWRARSRRSLENRPPFVATQELGMGLHHRKLSQVATRISSEWVSKWRYSQMVLSHSARTHKRRFKPYKRLAPLSSISITFANPTNDSFSCTSCFSSLNTPCACTSGSGANFSDGLSNNPPPPHEESTFRKYFHGGAHSHGYEVYHS